MINRIGTCRPRFAFTAATPIPFSRRRCTTSCSATNNKQRVIAISGPTGAGKSRLALELAKRLDGEIVSADSVQVYCGLDVGSAKPSLSERKEVPHHLIDILHPSQDYSAGQFFDDGRRATDDILSRGRVPIITGGTGLYLRWFIYGKPDVPIAIEEVTAEVNSELAQLERSYDWDAAVQLVVKAGDPSAQSLAANDWYRLRRRLEIIKIRLRWYYAIFVYNEVFHQLISEGELAFTILHWEIRGGRTSCLQQLQQFPLWQILYCRETVSSTFTDGSYISLIFQSSGSPPSAFPVPYDSFKPQLDEHVGNSPLDIRSYTDASQDDKQKDLDYDFMCFFLSSQRLDLYKSIDFRCENMLSGTDSLLSEASWLLELGLLPNSNSATRAIGYRQAMEYLLHCKSQGWSSTHDFYAFLSQFQKTSRNFAKRQLTWFRNEQIYNWIDASRPLEEVLNFVRNAYNCQTGNVKVPESLRMEKHVLNHQEHREIKAYHSKNRRFTDGVDCTDILNWISKTQVQTADLIT